MVIFNSYVKLPEGILHLAGRHRIIASKILFYTVAAIRSFDGILAESVSIDGLKGHLIEETMVFTCFYHQTWGFPWFS